VIGGEAGAYALMANTPKRGVSRSGFSYKKSFYFSYS